METCEREIDKAMYDRAMENHGYLTDEDMDKVFTTAELCGYGVYGAVVSHYAGRYVVRFEMGDSCDLKKSPSVLAHGQARLVICMKSPKRLSYTYIIHPRACNVKEKDKK